MSLTQVLALVLTYLALAEGQYGPLKGSSTRRTTTPFPPGFQSDNQLYNSVSNSITPDANQASHSFTYSDNSGVHSGSFSASASGCGGGGPGGGCGGAPSSGYGSLAGSNQKTPAGAASYSDNPWLSGIVAQHSGPGPAPSYQQTSPKVPCSVPGHVCVPRHQCQGGQTSTPGSGHRECDANTEVCCQYGQQQPSHQPAPTYQPSPQPGPGYGPPQRPHPQPQPAPTYQPGQPAPSYQPSPTYQPGQPAPTYQPSQRPLPQQRPTYQPAPAPHPAPQPGTPGAQPGPSFQPGQRPHPGSQPRPTYQPGQSPGPSQGSNYYPGSQRPQPQPSYQQPQPGYRPGTNGVPIGGSIYDSGAARPGSSYVTPAPIGPYTGPLNTTPHPGCPAALKCVEEIYCDVMGVMRDAPVQLTREEFENRVPLSECQNIETGIIGKCCRDPNYKDPWPDMNNGVFDDGHYHGEHGGDHGGHGGDHGAHPTQAQHQFHQQGTSSDSTCGPSATCTPQSQCSGGRQIQPGKQCRNPQDGSTGVCCSKTAFPSYSNNQQVNPSPTPPTHRPTPGQQYYTPKPSYSNNPFLAENQGRFPVPQQPSNQQPIRPTGISPVNYTPTQPNAIPGQDKDYDSGKQSTPRPYRPGYTTPQTPAVSGFQRPGYPQSPSVSPQPQAPSSNYPRPSSNPDYQRPSYAPSTTPQPGYPRPTQATASVSHYQPTNPSATNLPAFPQIATAVSVYSARPGSPLPSSTTPQPSSPSYHQPSPVPSRSSPGVSHQGALPGSNVHSSQSSFGTVSTTLAPPVESNDITPARGPGFSQTQAPHTPTRGRGPPAGYPFLAPTTEPNRRKPGQTASAAAPSSECGVRREVQRPNGPNGLETGFGEFPWHVQVLAAASQTPLCSGAILSPKVIVTAAHCIDDFTSEEVSVKAGDWKLGGDSSDEPKPAQIRNVAAIARHPKYDPVSRFYDMAVLILSEPLQIDEHVNVLCLGDNTPPGQRPSGTNCVVTGWGKANLQSNTPRSTMHSIPVSFIASEQCEDTFRKTNLGKYFQLNKSFFCAVPNSSNDDLCQVDVGSPIACQKPDGHYELSGIYSWDVGCHQPVAASNVDKPWVQSVMNKPVEQVKEEEKAEQQKKDNLGFNPENSDLTKPGFSQGYGKK